MSRRQSEICSSAFLPTHSRTSRVDGYLAAGYSGVVVTDHFNRITYNLMKYYDAPDEAQMFFDGYRLVKSEGEDRGLKVYRGAELRFDGSDNDYLIYNFPEEMLKDIHRVFAMTLEEFYKEFHTEDMLIIQAHPYRDGCTAADPRFLDGVEVENNSVGYDSHNHLALAFAQQHPHLIRTSGSDCHVAADIAQGGIVLSELPQDEKQLVTLLRQGKFTLK